MAPILKQWIASSRAKVQAGIFTLNDLDELEAIAGERQQRVLYLSSQSTNMRSPVSAWVLYDPTQPSKPQLPSPDPPYKTVLEALADGWRVVQFPVSKMYEHRGENDYVGFEFVLEKWI